MALCNCIANLHPVSEKFSRKTLDLVCVTKTKAWLSMLSSQYILVMMAQTFWNSIEDGCYSQTASTEITPVMLFLMRRLVNAARPQMHADSIEIHLTFQPAPSLMLIYNGTRPSSLMFSDGAENLAWDFLSPGVSHGHSIVSLAAV